MCLVRVLPHDTHVPGLMGDTQENDDQFLDEHQNATSNWVRPVYWLLRPRPIVAS
jgi:hypothetical protein